MEAGEALSGNRFVCNVFFEDGGEENRVWLVIFCGQDAGNSVAGDGNCWFAGATLLEELADLGGGQLAGGGGEVDSVGGDSEGYVGAGVDEEVGGGAFDGLKDSTGEGGEGGCGEVFFAELDKVDALLGPEGGLTDEGGLLVGIVAGEESAVGNGAAEHAYRVYGRGM